MNPILPLNQSLFYFHISFFSFWFMSPARSHHSFIFMLQWPFLQDWTFQDGALGNIYPYTSVFHLLISQPTNRPTYLLFCYHLSNIALSFSKLELNPLIIGKMVLCLSVMGFRVCDSSTTHHLLSEYNTFLIINLPPRFKVLWDVAKKNLTIVLYHIIFFHSLIIIQTFCKQVVDNVGGHVGKQNP